MNGMKVVVIFMLIMTAGMFHILFTMFDYGFNIKEAIKGPDSIITGIRMMQDYELIVDNESFNLIKELKNYIWNDKRSGKAIDAHNHLIDAIRYYCAKELTSVEFFVL